MQKIILLLCLSISPCGWSQDKSPEENVTDEGKEAKESTDAASPSPSPTPPKRQELPINLDKELHQLLSKELEQDDLVALSAMGEEFFCIWKHTSIGKALGAVILLHEEGQNADWPLTINSLRVKLADHGWSTLAVSLPNPHAPPILLRPTPVATPLPIDAEMEAKKEAEKEQTQSENPKEDQDQEKEGLPETTPEITQPVEEKSAMDIEVMVKARLEAAIKHLHSVGQFNLVIVGSGLGAARASVFINQLMSSSAKQEMSKNATSAAAKAIIKRPIRALVLVNARNAIPGSDENLPGQLTDPGLPILDIVFNDHYLDEYEAKERRQKASRQQMENYYQVTMRRPVGGAGETNNRLVKRVRGFLNRHAKGVEIPK